MAVEFHRTGPRAELRGTVIRIEGFAQRASAPVRFCELPCTFVPLIVDIGEGWRVSQGAAVAEAHGSFIAGLTDGPVMVEHPGRAACVQIDLTPLGARRLLGMPMSELANRTVALADVLGRDWRGLAERVAAEPAWPERVAHVERALLARLAQAPAADPGVAWALARIAAAPGRIAIGQVSRDLGWSHRRLISRFRDQVGVTPRTVARIARFERMRDVVAADPAIEWARAAPACGYYDQSHLAREVRALAAMTPTELRVHGVNFVQDPEFAAT